MKIATGVTLTILNIALIIGVRLGAGPTAYYTIGTIVGIIAGVVIWAGCRRDYVPPFETAFFVITAVTIFGAIWPAVPAIVALWLRGHRNSCPADPIVLAPTTLQTGKASRSSIEDPQ